MKVLVLSVTAGQGHNSTAKAICNYFQEMGIEAEMLDTLMYLNKALGKAVDKGYLLAVDSAKKAYAQAYKKLEHRKKNGNDKSAIRSIVSLMAPKLKEYIDEYKPDVIISTHVFACMIIDTLKQNQEVTAKTIGIVTDFTFHPYWEEIIHFDYVVTSCESLIIQGLKKGFREDQILPIGIPINPKFRKNIDKTEARKELGLDPDKLTVMIMGGSMGYGNIAKTVAKLESLDKDFQIVAVCGSNKKAKEKIDKMEHTKPLLCLGFCDNVEVIMSASDCIVTKPGGLTSSEALAKNLPLIIINPIPGQEDRNSEFLVNHGAAIRITDTYPIDEALYSLFSSPERLRLMREAVDIIRKPDSTVTLCEFARSLVENEENK